MKTIGELVVEFMKANDWKVQRMADEVSKHNGDKQKGFKSSSFTRRNRATFSGLETRRLEASCVHCLHDCAA